MFGAASGTSYSSSTSGNGNPLYPDFPDVIGPETGFDLPGIRDGTDFEKFRAKARAFLHAHLDHVAIQKLRRNKPLTATDVVELERMLVDNEIGGPTEIGRAKKESQGLGLFVRSLVGLERNAAQEAMGRFLDGKRPTSSQIDFVHLIVDT